MNAELKEIVHAQSNELFDVATLIKAAMRLSEIYDDDLHRLLGMASEKILNIQNSFDPHI